MDIHAITKGKTPAILMMVAIVCTALIGYLDYITGYELRIDVFYLLPISFVAWYISGKAGILISSLSLLFIFFSDLLSKPDHHVHLFELWNMAMVFLFFLIVTLSLSKFKITLDRQRHLTTELEKALYDLKSTNESLEAFSYSVSHDLKGPLWRIQGYAEIVADKYSPALGENGNDYIRRILSGTQRMNELIDALLKLSLYSEGNLIRSTVDLSAMVRRTLEESAKSRPERAVETVTADGVTADGDPALLQVVLFNLIENALKFTRHRPAAKIEFGFTKIGGKNVYFIRDNGAGFSMANAKRLFSPFERLHSESDFPGFGIGLATVQRIIHRHGGQIWAESGVDQGATFYFTLD